MTIYKCDKCPKTLEYGSELHQYTVGGETIELCNECWMVVQEATMEHVEEREEIENTYRRDIGQWREKVFTTAETISVSRNNIVEETEEIDDSEEIAGEAE